MDDKSADNKQPDLWSIEFISAIVSSAVCTIFWSAPYQNIKNTIELFSFDGVLSCIGFLVSYAVLNYLIMKWIVAFVFDLFNSFSTWIHKKVNDTKSYFKWVYLIIPLTIFFGTIITFNYLDIPSRFNKIENFSNENVKSQDEIDKNYTRISINDSNYKDRFKVTALADIDYNNSVGNSWAFYFEVNDKEITEDGTVVFVEAGDRVDLYVECTDYDDVPETGYNSAYIEIEKGDYFNGFYVEVPVVVTENRGKYYGNEAQFTVTFYFDPIIQN